MGSPIIAYQTTYPVNAFLEKRYYLLSIYLQRNKKPKKKHSKTSYASDFNPIRFSLYIIFLMLINLLEMKVIYIYNYIYIYIYATYTNDF